MHSAPRPIRTKMGAKSLVGSSSSRTIATPPNRVGGDDAQGAVYRQVRAFRHRTQFLAYGSGGWIHLGLFDDAPDPTRESAVWVWRSWRRPRRRRALPGPTAAVSIRTPASGSRDKMRR
jgi:hypothetical protein